MKPPLFLLALALAAGSTVFAQNDSVTGAVPPLTPYAVTLSAREGDASSFASARYVFPTAGWTVRERYEVKRDGALLRILVEVVPPPAGEPVLTVITETGRDYNLGILPNGRYEVRLEAGGLIRARTTLQVGPEAPPPPPLLASAAAAPLTDPAATEHPLFVTYLGAAVDLGTLGGDDLQILRGHAPAGLSARFVRLVPAVTPAVAAANAERPVTTVYPPVLATVAEYAVRRPGANTDAVNAAGWPNGEFAVHLRAESVAAADGRFFPAGKIGAFAVRLADRHALRPEQLTAVVFESSPGAFAVWVRATYLPVDAALSWGEPMFGDGGFKVEIHYTAPVPPPGEIVLPAFRTEERVLPLPPVATFAPVPAGTLTSVTVTSLGRPAAYDRLLPDADGGPYAKLRAPALRQPGAEPYVFESYLHAAAGLDLAALRGADVRLRPWGPVAANARLAAYPAELVALEPVVPSPASASARAPQLVRATYRVEAPGGFWDPAERGRWEVFVADPTAVRDVAGTVLSRPVLGSFDVLFPAPPPPAPVPGSVTLTAVTVEGRAAIEVAVTLPAGWAVPAEWGEAAKLGSAVVAKARFDRLANTPPANHDGLETFAHTYLLPELPPGRWAFEFATSLGHRARLLLEVPGPATDGLAGWNARDYDPVAGLPPLTATPGAVRDYFHGNTSARLGVPLRVQPTADAAVFRLTYRRNALATDVVARYEVSTNLRDWTDVTESAVVVETEDLGEGIVRVTVELTLAAAPAGPLYARLRLERPEGP